MKKILTIKNVMTVTEQLRQRNKIIVLVGGCFDILHPGHVVFLQKAKQKGDILLVWVESDEALRKRKGEHRPIHTQKDRASVLAALSCVDYVVLLPYFTKNEQYDDLVKHVQPAIIAATKGDTEVEHKKRAAKVAGAKLAYVTRRIPDQSTSRVARLVAREE